MKIGRQEIVRLGGLQDTYKIMLFQNSNQSVEIFIEFSVIS
jgi:hypothetical protein